MPINSQIPFDQLRRDVYFREDFTRLHARHGVVSATYDEFSCRTGIVPIAGADRIDLETPWGYGGPIAENKEALDNGLTRWTDHVRQDLGAVAEFIRFHPFLDPAPHIKHLDMIEYNRDIVVIRCDADVNERWKYYSDSTKNCIRKASSRCEIRLLTASDARLFHEFYEAGLNRNLASNEYFFDQNFYPTLLASPWAKCWLACSDDGAAAVACFLHSDTDLCHYHLAGGNDLSRKLNIHYALIENAVMHYKGLGVRYMILGGGRSTDPNDALLKFKRKFSPLVMPYFVGGKIYDYDAYIRYGGGRKKFLCEGLEPGRSERA